MIDNTTMASSGSANTSTPAHPLGQALSSPLCPHREAILHPEQSFGVSTGISFSAFFPQRYPKLGTWQNKTELFSR
jgi:hypothetical protein